MDIYNVKESESLMALNKAIINNIVKYREEKGFTIEALADYTGLSSKYIKKIEKSNGKMIYSLNSIYKISTALKVDMNKFFDI